MYPTKLRNSLPPPPPQYSHLLQLGDKTPARLLHLHFLNPARVFVCVSCTLVGCIVTKLGHPLMRYRDSSRCRVLRKLVAPLVPPYLIVKEVLGQVTRKYRDW